MGAPLPQIGQRVDVGVGVLVLHEGLVLLVRQRGSHGAGCWSAPGGRLECCEALQQCAKRELDKEAGLATSHFELGPYSNDLFPEVGRQFLAVVDVARGLRGQSVNREPDKCAGWAWFRWGEWSSPPSKPV